jgi:hypothetical protein
MLRVLIALVLATNICYAQKCYIFKNQTHQVVKLTFLYNSPVGNGMPLTQEILSGGAWPQAPGWCWNTPSGFTAQVELSVGAAFRWPGALVLGNGPSGAPSGTYVIEKPKVPQPPPAPVSKWYGFANSLNLDREAELASRCGQFVRITVHPKGWSAEDVATGAFNDLCDAVHKRCVRVCDWEQHDKPCNELSQPHTNDGARIALCLSPGETEPPRPPPLPSPPPSPWEGVPGKAVDIGVGRNDVWVIGTNALPGGYGIYHRTASGWNEVPGAAVAISVDGTGAPWVVNAAGQIFRGDRAGAWTPLPGAAVDIGVGADGTAWVIGTNSIPGGYGIYKWDGATWKGVPGAAIRIAVAPNGEPWVVNSTNQIFRGDINGNWTLMPGAATDIGVGADGTVVVIGTNNEGPGGFGIWRWDGSKWVEYPGGAAIRIAVDGGGRPWVVNQAHDIFQHR